MREKELALKLCVNCHAQVDKDVVICPYCRTNFQQNYFSSSQESKENLSMEESIGSLYPPPYQQKVPDMEEKQLGEQEELMVEKDTNMPVIWPYVLCVIGTYLFLFGLFLGVFSSEGYLSLRFSASFWYLYFLASIPILVISYRLLNKIK